MEKKNILKEIIINALLIGGIIICLLYIRELDIAAGVIPR